MSTAAGCSRCGAPLDDSSNDTICARCRERGEIGSLESTRLAGGPSQKSSEAPALPSCEELSRRFGELEVRALLGRGGMGAVYLARQTRLDRLVALKIMAPWRERDAIFEERFLREARTLAKLSHPHIVQVYDVGQTAGFCYILMQYVEGASLRQRMREGRITPTEAIRLIPQICDAMEYAHRQGIVHRDIKPENVLVDLSGQIKIADFGLAKLTEAAGPSEPALTGSWARMGTIHYMAPEQVENTAAVDHRADIYSLGVMFYEMLTGKLPTLNYLPPSRVTTVDARLDQVVERSLKSSPHERFQQMSDIRAALQRLEGSHGRKKFVGAVAASALVAAIGVFGGMVAWNAEWNPWRPRSDERTSQRPDEPRTDDDGDKRPDDAAPGAPGGATTGGDATAQSSTRLVAPFDAEVARAQQQRCAKECGHAAEWKNSLGMEFRLIPPGEFEIDAGHRVQITNPFHVGAHEVTVGQFRQFVAATNFRTLAEMSGQGGFIHRADDPTQFENNPEYIWSHPRFGDSDSLPVAQVMLADAQMFCEWLSGRGEGRYRLPSEAEWLWMDRAGQATLTSLKEPQDEVTELGWIKENAGGRSHPVGQKLPNAWGVFDTAGNVCELTSDGFFRNYPPGLVVNPRNPIVTGRILALGSNMVDPRRNVRFDLNDKMPFYSIGFRVVRELPAK